MEPGSRAGLVLRCDRAAVNTLKELQVCRFGRIGFAYSVRVMYNRRACLYLVVYQALPLPMPGIPEAGLIFGGQL